MRRDNYWEVTLSHPWLSCGVLQQNSGFKSPSTSSRATQSVRKERERKPNLTKKEEKEEGKKSWKPSRQKCTILSLGQSSRRWLLCFSFKVRACYWSAYSRPRNCTVCCGWFADSLSRSAIWFAGGGESVRSRSSSMAGTFSSLPGCEGIDPILAARGKAGDVCT